MSDLRTEPPPLTSRRVTLRPLLPSDGEWFYSLVCGPAGEQWRYRGRTPAHDMVAADMWRGVFAQFVVTDVRTGERCGVVGLYNVALEAGRAHLFVLSAPGHSATSLEAAGLLCSWGFGHHGFERIFIETAEFNLQRFASLADVATVEGRLRNYEWWKGRYWDQFILSITPNQFEERFGETLRRRAHDTLHRGAEPDDLFELVDEIWPLDSLGMVEVLDLLEDITGAPVDVAWLDGADDSGPKQWSSAVLEGVRARQQRGS